MNVLSLFAGISCGYLALKRAGIKVDNYFASEINPNAKRVALSNHPSIQYVPEVTTLQARHVPKIDLLIGGSPCQGFSGFGNELNFSDPRSKLFFEYVRILKEVQPTYFFLENVSMRYEFHSIISKYLGVKPIYACGGLVSAAIRQRMFWANFPLRIPAARDITFDDIADKVPHDITPLAYVEKLLNYKCQRNPILTAVELGKKQKLPTICAKNRDITRCHYVLRPGIGYSPLSQRECERAFNLPDGYTRELTQWKAIEHLGNGWTVNLISHFFEYFNRIKTNEK
jgi:DNA (cytosine-5)-methyltransferase 3A